jgi:hypothetical protein
MRTVALGTLPPSHRSRAHDSIMYHHEAAGSQKALCLDNLHSTPLKMQFARHVPPPTGRFQVLGSPHKQLSSFFSFFSFFFFLFFRLGFIHGILYVVREGKKKKRGGACITPSQPVEFCGMRNPQTYCVDGRAAGTRRARRVSRTVYRNTGCRGPPRNVQGGLKAEPLVYFLWDLGTGWVRLGACLPHG